MLGDRYECKYVAAGCPGAGDSPLCTDHGGRLDQGDGKRAECYKDMSVLYRTARFLRHPFRRIAEGLSTRVTEGVMKAEGIEKD